ncbi:MAG: cyclase family protein [Gammaproteobacteria bacterium]
MSLKSRINFNAIVFRGSVKYILSENILSSEQVCLMIIVGTIGFIGLLCGYYYLVKPYKFNSLQGLKKFVAEVKNKSSSFEKKRSTYKDLTAIITSKTVVFPGDPIFRTEPVTSMEDGSPFNLCQIHMGNHTGTHIDFPAHVLKDGKVSNDYPIERLISDGLIIETPDTASVINKTFIDKQDILESDFVFFKTSNSDIPKQGPFRNKYVYIEPEAAQSLIQKKVRAVGIDYISVDAYEAEDLPVHKMFLANDILIVENLELKGIEAGRCKLFVMPLNVADMDGLPARVMMSR